MSAHYDSYDYPSYWEGREYENESEVIAIKSLLNKIPRIKTIIDIGGGYGRLTPTYSFRAKKIILTDPSAKLLSVAKNNLKENNKVELIQSLIENLPTKIKSKSVDLAIMVRVIHHLEKPEKAFKIVHRILKPGGYFIIEFANKSHGKAVIRELAKGNLTFSHDIFPQDIRSARNIRKGTIPFINYHPDEIVRFLKESGFNVIEKLSVSNIRNTKLKSLISLENLLSLERVLQKPLSYINFGPSIFILARKED
jgi:ubiquinone/menaquinone biosynthesis C-methylase UbiE